MNRPTRYSLRVSLSIVKEEWSGSYNTANGATIESDGGYWSPMGNDRLTVEETMQLGTLDFMGVMGVLGKLHEAVNAVKPNV